MYILEVFAQPTYTFHSSLWAVYSTVHASENKLRTYNPHCKFRALSHYKFLDTFCCHECKRSQIYLQFFKTEFLSSKFRLLIYSKLRANMLNNDTTTFVFNLSEIVFKNRVVSILIDRN